MASLGRNGHRRPPVELSFNARRSIDSFLGSCTLPYSEAATIGRFHRYCGGCIARVDFALDAPSPRPRLSFLAGSFQSRASICLVMCAGIPDQPSTARQTFNIKNTTSPGTPTAGRSEAIRNTIQHGDLVL